MDFKHVKMVSEKKAEIRLYETIGRGGSTGGVIASEIQFLIEYVEVTEILVRINSGGGSMLEGFGIFSAIQAAIEKGINVITQCDGVAASMASIILLAGTKRKIADFGLVMLHDPAPKNIETKLDEKTVSMLRKFKDSAIKMYMSATSLSKEQLDDLMTKETWLDASQALEMGFVTDVLTTGKNVENNLKDNFDADELVGVFNSIINNEFYKKPNMKSIALSLGLNADATEAQIVDMINTNKKVLGNSKQHVAALVALGVANGHVTEDNKGSYEKLATSEYDTVFNLFSKSVVKEQVNEEKPKGEEEPPAPVNMTDVLEKDVPNDDPNDKKNWDFDMWSKNDPEGLLAMKQNDSEAYTALAMAYAEKK